jgi:N-dimethylarginine dimethylaminohydrolase
MPQFNTHVLMSDAHAFSTNLAINPYYSDSAPNVTQVQAEHDSIKQMLESAGVTVTQVTAPEDSQDGVYTANWALIKGQKAILSRLPDARKAEEVHAKQILTNLGIEVIEVPNNLRFSGQGDALPFGNFLFCGQGYRADLDAQVFAAETLGFTRIQLQTIPELDKNGIAVTNPISGWPDSFFYDIDLAIAILRPPVNDQKGLIAYCPEAFTSESQQILANFEHAEKILIPLDEAIHGFAANLVSTGETVIMSDNAPGLKEAIENHGFTVLTPKITELVKGGGYIRCTSLSFNEDLA